MEEEEHSPTNIKLQIQIPNGRRKAFHDMHKIPDPKWKKSIPRQTKNSRSLVKEEEDSTTSIKFQTPNEKRRTSNEKHKIIDP